MHLVRTLILVQYMYVGTYVLLARKSGWFNLNGRRKEKRRRSSAYHTKQASQKENS